MKEGEKKKARLGGYVPMLHLYLHSMRAYFSFLPQYYDLSTEKLFPCYNRIRETINQLPDGRNKTKLFTKLQTLEESESEEWLSALADLQYTALVLHPDTPFVRTSKLSFFYRLIRSGFRRDLQHIRKQKNKVSSCDPENQQLCFLVFLSQLIPYFLTPMERKRVILRTHGLLDQYRSLQDPTEKESLFLLINLYFFKSSLGINATSEVVDEMIQDLKGNKSLDSNALQSHLETFSDLIQC